MEPQVTCDLPDGPNNWIQWRAKDVAGNGPTASPSYQVPVDSQGVSYHGFYPPPVVVQQDPNVTVNITIADFGGSGVNISTFQVAIKASGDTTYSDWYEPEFIIDSQTAPFSEPIQSGPEIMQLSASIAGFKNGTENYIKFRIRDAAGNGFTESEEFNIHLDLRSFYSGDTVTINEFMDFWVWLLLLLIILVLVILTIWNYEYRYQDSQEK